jgi:hypothetical protein
MANSTSQLVFMELERVAPKLPHWMTMYMVAVNKFGKGTATRVSERDFRIPVKTSAGSRPGTYNPNSGPIGRGGYMTGAVMVQTFYPLRSAFELPQLAMEVTASPEASVRNALKEAVADATKEFSLFQDSIWHAGMGNATLGVARAVTTTSGNTVYTMDDGTGAATVNSLGNFAFGVRTLRRGWGVTVYNNAMTTQYGGGPYIILAIDYGANTVTLSGTVPSAQATDVLCYEGVSGSSPVGITGLPYFHDDSTSGTTLGINRATEPEIRCNSVDASAGLNHQLGLQLFHRIFQRRGEVAKDLMGLAPDNAQYTIYGEIMNIARYDINDKSGYDPKDLLPDVDMSFKFGSVKYTLDPREPLTRMDVVNFPRWGKALAKEVSFYKPGDGAGSQYFTLYGSDGSPAAGTWFGMTTLVNYYTDDPGGAGFLKGIPLSSGY